MPNIINIQDNQEELKNITKDIENMSAQELSALSNSISILNSILSLDEKIGDDILTTSSSTIKGAINELKTTISTIQSSITSLQASVRALEESINNQSPTT